MIYFWGKCEMCGEMTAVCLYHQNTQYVHAPSNWACLCDECMEINDEHWDERWAEYYGGLA